MKKVKVLLASLLSITVVLGTVVPSYAAEPVSEVKIEIEATDMNVSVTVPSTLPIIFNADGTNTFADNWTIENVSALAGIHVTNVHLNGDGTGWKVVKDSETVKTQTVNGKSVKFFVGVPGTMQLVQPSNGSESETGTASFGENDICIPSGGEKTLEFAVERGAFTETTASAKAFSMTLDFAFN